MDFTDLFTQGKTLLEYFGWYSILLVVGTFAIMFGLNILYKKIFKSQDERIVRTRKLVSFVSVFLVSAGLVTLFTAVVLKKPLTVTYVLGASSSCGILAQTLWFVWKIVRDLGFAPLLAKLKSDKAFLKELEKCGLTKGAFKVIMSQVEEFVDEKGADDVDKYLKEHDYDLTLKISDCVKGFAKAESVSEAIRILKEKVLKDYE